MPQPAETRQGRDVIARVGDSDVTADEIRAVIGLLDPRQQAALARDPALLSQTVRTLLANRLVLKEALAKKWDQQPAVTAQIELARENAIVESYLQSLTTPPADYPGEADLKASMTPTPPPSWCRASSSSPRSSSPCPRTPTRRPRTRRAASSTTC